MAVRKVENKDSRVSGARGRIAESPELQAIRGIIKSLPPDEGGTMATEDEGEGPKKKKSRAKKSGVKKKVAAAAKSNGASEGTTLSDICKSLKMEPRTARRKLRNADGVPEAGDRWTWTKASDVAKVKKILSAE